MAHLLLGTPGRAYFFVKLIANTCRFSCIVIHLGRDVSTGQEIRMHLRQVKNKKTGRTYLSIVQSYRGADGKVRSKTLESLGSLDELRRSHDDPVAHFRAVCERRNAEARDAGSPVTIEFPRLEKVDKRGPSPVSVGCAPVLSYMGALGVTSFFKNRSFRRALGYDPCRVLELLVCDRVIDPHSKRGAWESRASFPRACGFSLHDVYRCLDYLQANADALVASMNAEVASGRGRDRSGSYYDVTNYYFECDCDEPGGLRQRGCSKEHRPNPIVQMGLLLDGEGIPIGYDLFPGNTNDCLTMMPVLKKAREGGAMGGQDRRGRRQGAQHLRQHRRLHPRRQRLRLRAVGEEVRLLAQEVGALRRRLRVGRRVQDKVASGRQGHHPARPRREGDRRAARAGEARRLLEREVRQARGGRAGQGNREGEEDGALPRELRAREGGRRRALCAREEGGPRDGRAGEERRGA